MKQRRIIFIFLFFALTLMACNLTNMVSKKGEDLEPFVELTPDSDWDEMADESMDEPLFNEEQNQEPINDSESFSPASTDRQSACDHPYFPLRQGATWVYYDASDAYYHHWEVVSVSGDQENANAIMQVFTTPAEELNEDQKSSAIELEYNWVCSIEEGIVSFDMASLDYSDLGNGSFTMTMENVEGEGVIMPPADRLEPGYEWEMKFNADFRAEGLMGANGTVQVSDFYNVLSKNPVQFNGETFEGLQYQRKFNIDMVIKIDGVEAAVPSSDFNFLTYTVVAKNIGFVTMDSDTDLGKAGLQLIRYNIP